MSDHTVAAGGDAVAEYLKRYRPPASAPAAADDPVHDYLTRYGGTQEVRTVRPPTPASPPPAIAASPEHVDLGRVRSLATAVGAAAPHSRLFPLDDELPGVVVPGPARPAAAARPAVATGAGGTWDPDLPLGRDVLHSLIRGGGEAIASAGGAVRALPALARTLVRGSPLGELGEIAIDRSGAFAHAQRQADAVGTPITEVGERIEAAHPRTGSVAHGPAFQPTNPRWWMEGAAEMAPVLLTQLGLAAATGGGSAEGQLAAFAAPMAVQSGGGAFNRAYRTARQQGLPEEDATHAASGAALLSGTAAAALQGIPGAAVLLGRVPGARRVFGEALAEGMTKALAGVPGRIVAGGATNAAIGPVQSAWDDLVQYAATADPEAFADWQQRYAASAAHGLALGLAFGAAHGAGHPAEAAPDAVAEPARRSPGESPQEAPASPGAVAHEVMVSVTGRDPTAPPEIPPTAPPAAAETTQAAAAASASEAIPAAGVPGGAPAAREAPALIPEGIDEPAPPRRLVRIPVPEEGNIIRTTPGAGTVLVGPPRDLADLLDPPPPRLIRRGPEPERAVPAGYLAPAEAAPPPLAETQRSPRLGTREWYEREMQRTVADLDAAPAADRRALVAKRDYLQRELDGLDPVKQQERAVAEAEHQARLDRYRDVEGHPLPAQHGEVWDLIRSHTRGLEARELAFMYPEALPYADRIATLDDSWKAELAASAVPAEARAAGLPEEAAELLDTLADARGHRTARLDREVEQRAREAAAADVEVADHVGDLGSPRRGLGEAGEEGGARAEWRRQVEAESVVDPVSRERFLHDGKGSPDLGEISPEMGTVLDRSPAPIRMATKRLLSHLTALRAGHITELGFDSPVDFVRQVAKNFDAVYRGGGGAGDLVLVERGDGSPHPTARDVGSAGDLVVILDRKNRDDPFYRVVSAGLRRPDFFRGKELLWEAERSPKGASDGPGAADHLTTSAGGSTESPIASEPSREGEAPAGAEVRAITGPQQPAAGNIPEAGADANPDDLGAPRKPAAGRIDVAPLPGGDPAQLRDIAGQLSKALGRRFREGTARRGAAGTYSPTSGRIQVRYHGDLDVTSHEVAHHLDDRYGITAAWSNGAAAPFDGELIPHFSQYGSKGATLEYQRAEGVAEWVRAWLANPAAAEAAAPLFADHFKRTLPAPVRDELGTFSHQLRQVAGLSARELTKLNIALRPKQEKVAERLQDAFKGKGYTFETTPWMRFRAQMADSMAPLWEGVKKARELRRAGDPLPESDPKVLVRLFAGINGKINDIFEHGPVNAKGERVTGVGGIKWLMEPLDSSSFETLHKDADDAVAMMVSQRVIERSSVIDREIDEEVQGLRNAALLARHNEQKVVERAARRLREMAAVTSRREERAGLALDRVGAHTDQQLGQAGKDVERVAAALRVLENAAATEAERARADAAGVATRNSEEGAAVTARAPGRLRRTMRAKQREASDRVTSLGERTGRRIRRLGRGVGDAAGRAEGVQTAVLPARGARLQRTVREARAVVKSVQQGGIDAMERQIANMQKRADRLHEVRLARIDRYEAAKRAEGEHRKAHLSGVGKGLRSDLDVANDVLSDLRREPARHVRLQEAARRYRAWSNAVLHYWVEKGRMTPETEAQIHRDNGQYTAMHRAQEAIDPSGFHRGNTRVRRQLGSAKKVIEHFEGGTAVIDNPYINLLHQTHLMVMEADRNEAVRAFTDELLNPRGLHEGAALDLDAIGSRVLPDDPDGIRVYRDGKEERWQFEEGIHSAFKNWNQVDDPDVLWALAKLPGRIMQYGVTHAPPFLVRNVMRDALHRTLVSDVKSRPHDVVAPIARTFTRRGREANAEQVSELRRYGGDQAGNYAQDRIGYYGELRRRMQDLAKDKSTLLLLPGRAVGAWGKLAQGSEMVGRLAEHRRALEHARKELGYDEYNAHLYAAFQARSLLDYAVAGTSVRKLNQVVRFTNAGVQGLRRLKQSAKEHPAQLTARWTALLVAPSLLALAAARGGGYEEEYRNLPAYQRDMFWNFKVGPDFWVRIPKPFEAGTLASGVERWVDSLTGGEHAADGYAGDLARSFFPMDEGALVGPLRPGIEAVANHDFFRERNIIPPYERGLDLRLRHTEKASRLGQAAQATFGVDGRYIDHVVNGELGGSGRILLRATDVGREDKPATDWAAELSGIMTRSPAFNARDVQYVLTRAHELGYDQSAQIRSFKVLLRRASAAGSAAERDAAARALRERASVLRGDFEKRDVNPRRLRRMQLQH